ncbi:MAG: hypothetical protein IMX04_00900 [Candidatus Carbobacillus altaicus]|nr:hypothetical protein [Candidatus Carbobacillus altaicus]
MLDAFWKELGAWFQHMSPRINTQEDDTHVTVILHLPNDIDVRDITIHPTEHALHLAYTGSQVHRWTDEDRGYTSENVSSRAFNFTYPFPKPVIPGSMQVARGNGTLQLTFKKR